MLSRDAVRDLILAALPGAEVTVKDLTGTEDHYEVHVVSDVFGGKSPLARHRLVYSALGAHVGGAVHALALKTETKTEQRG